MFKPKANPFVLLVLVLIIASALAGCAPKTATLSEPAVQPAQPTDAPVPSPAAPASEWEQVSQMEAPVTLRMAAFMDQNTGISGGPDQDGIARTTSDGGKTWSEGDNSSGCLFGLEVIDAQTMWECNASNIRVTTDGGQTWSGRASGMGQPGCKISAVDAETAFVVTPSELVVTHDGGLTRETLPLPGDLQTSKIAAISFRSQTDGAILDGGGKLYGTTDGGQTWQSLPSLDMSKFGELALRTNKGQPYAAMRFFDARHGLLVLSLAGGGANKVVALRTADGGQTWDEQPVDAPYSTPYLSRDGKFLTLVSAFTNDEITILRYTGD